MNAETISSEAKELFANLPAGEVSDDEPLWWGHVVGGLLALRTARNTHYVLRDGQTLRFERIGEVEHLTVFVDQQAIRRVTLEPQIVHLN
jgi:hypothetical protein